jgi:hypothetical protein
MPRQGDLIPLTDEEMQARGKKTSRELDEARKAEAVTAQDTA